MLERPLGWDSSTLGQTLSYQAHRHYVRMEAPCYDVVARRGKVSPSTMSGNTGSWSTREASLRLNKSEPGFGSEDTCAKIKTTTLRMWLASACVRLVLGGCDITGALTHKVMDSARRLTVKVVSGPQRIVLHTALAISLPSVRCGQTNTKESTYNVRKTAILISWVRVPSFKRQVNPYSSSTRQAGPSPWRMPAIYQMVL